MKELSIEEKANAYDNVRNKIAARFGTNVAQEIFSEYEESENEKIRKWLINEIKIKHHNLDEDNVDFVDKAIAWLEKQRNPNKEYWRGYKDGKKAILEKYSELKKPTEWSKEDIGIIEGMIIDYRGEIEHLSNSTIDEQAKPIYQERIDFLNRLKTCCPELYNVQKKIDNAIYLIEHYATHGHDKNLRNKVIDELEYVKHELEKQGEKTKPIEGFDTEFERQISHLIASAIDREHEYNEGYVKWTANALLEYAKRELEKQGSDISSFPKEQQVFMQKYISLDKITLIKLLAERDANNAEIIESFEKQGERKSTDNLTQQEAMDIAVAKCFEQDGQKPVDKVEPKFKNGQWIVFNGLTLYINEVVQGYYRTTSIGGIPNSYDWNIDNAARLWTIQDAKPGDVLISQHNKPFIYSGKYNDYKVWAYCGIDTVEEFIDTCAEMCWTDNKFINPATKEQRDLLFQKMYEWNADKKELKKIEPLTDFEKAFQGMCCEKNKQFVKECCKTLIELARKQLQSERNELELDETSYKVGVSRVLENPESYGLTKSHLKPSSSDIEALEDIMNGNSNPTAYLVLQSIIEQLKTLK